MLISFDSETTGPDFRHGAKPFFITISDDDNNVHYWEWDVNPFTRQPCIPFNKKTQTSLDLLSICQMLSQADEIVLQNAKFDVHAMASLAKSGINWPWDKTFDTLLAGHLLASNLPHDLTSMAIQYLGIDIQPLEDALEVAIKKCRPIGKKLGWRIAKAGLEDMPSARETTWKFDSWLPRAVAQEQNLPDDHPWWTVLRDYSNADSAVTLLLWKVMREEIEAQGLWEIYLHRVKTAHVTYRMESYGATGSMDNLDHLCGQYEEENAAFSNVCVNIAKSYDYDLQLPKSGNNNKSLKTFVFDVLKLPVVKTTETGQPSLDSKESIPTWLRSLPQKSKAYTFVKSLGGKGKRDTSINYMHGYRRFARPVYGEGEEVLPGWYRIHPSFNLTGSVTLRFSCQNPNAQNISKQEAKCEVCEGDKDEVKTCKACDGTGKSMTSVRYCFGPAPGREWWSLDAKNIELRLPAYESEQEELIALFEKANEPPFYGSEHLLNFSIVYEDIWNAELKEVGIEKVGPHCKKKYAGTYYQWCKNGDFAIGYGCQRAKADSTFRRDGAFDLLKSKFAKKEKLNKYWIDFADKNGYVETIVDRSLKCKRGYPLLCTRTQWGKVLPTVPLNYHIQGSAMWWTTKAMVRVQEQLDTWNRQAGEDLFFLTLQIHDELVLDFPKSDNDPTKEDGKSYGPSNRWRIEIVKKLMEQGGHDFGIPTPVGVEYNPNNWSEGIVVY